MDSLPAATQLLKTLFEQPDTDWDQCVDEDSGPNHITGFRRINNEGKPSTHMQIKLRETFPEVTPDQFWEMATNMDKRVVWDTERVQGYEVLGEGENGGTVVYTQGAKPPIPLVSARDTVLNTWKDEVNLGEGRRAFIWSSVEHEKKPVTSAFVRANAEVLATIVEANPGGGTLVNEFRSIDVGGQMLAMAIDKGSKMGPKKNFEQWCKGVAGKKWE